MNAGQSFPNCRRILVVFEDADGMYHAWESLGGDARWEMTGLSQGRTEARMTTIGPFHRKSQGGILTDYAQIDGPPKGLGR